MQNKLSGMRRRVWAMLLTWLLATSLCFTAAVQAKALPASGQLAGVTPDVPNIDLSTLPATTNLNENGYRWDASAKTLSFINNTGGGSGDGSGGNAGIGSGDTSGGGAGGGSGDGSGGNAGSDSGDTSGGNTGDNSSNSSANAHTYRIVQSNTALTQAQAIIVESGVSTKIIIYDINIPGDYSPLRLRSTASLELWLEGDNVLSSSTSATSANTDSAAGVSVPPGATLTIDGSGTLTAIGGKWGAGIGGTFKAACGDVTINGGTITATGKDSAGIGAGFRSSGGTITITGGSVTAIGTGGSSGIGAADAPDSFSTGDSPMSITITGGTVVAKNEPGTSIGGFAIGGGRGYGVGEINITGATITASGHRGAIGASSGTINIGGTAVVNATSEATSYNMSGPGIGFIVQEPNQVHTINISGGNITVASANGVGIGIQAGGNTPGQQASINISGGTIKATSYSNNSIGNDDPRYTDCQINISGGSINAICAKDDTPVTAIGSDNFGANASKTDIVISGGIIKAKGSSAGCGIAGTSVVIKDSAVVYAYSGSNSPIAITCRAESGAKIDTSAQVFAFAEDQNSTLTHSAVRWKTDNQGSGHFLVAYLNEYPANDLGYDLDLLLSNGTRFTLPAGYNSFAVSTGLALASEYRIRAYSSTGIYLGRLERSADSSPILVSSKTSVGIPVKLNDKVPITSLSLEPASLRLFCGEDRALTPTILPDDAVLQGLSWTSSAKAVAEVDQAGKVSGRTAGSAVVSATSEGGNASDSCAVAVAYFIRHAGENRSQTAALASKQAFPDAAKVSTAIVAFAGNFPDALTASFLAGVCEAPILLSPTDGLDKYTAAELKRLGPSKVYIVGGTGVLSAKVRSQLVGLPSKPEVKRLGGATRYETSLAIATEALDLMSQAGLAKPTEFFLATGEGFPDALAVSPFATFKHIPVLIIPKAGISAAVKRFIAANSFSTGTVVGGVAVVAQSAEVSLADMLGAANVSRIGGATRYQTSAGVLAKLLPRYQMSPTLVALATGDMFPDALSGGAAIGARGGVVVLTSGTALNDSARASLLALRDNRPDLEILGGTAAVGAATEKAVKGIYS